MTLHGSGPWSPSRRYRGSRNRLRPRVRMQRGRGRPLSQEDGVDLTAPPAEVSWTPYKGDRASGLRGVRSHRAGQWSPHRLRALAPGRGPGGYPDDGAYLGGRRRELAGPGSGRGRTWRRSRRLLREQGAALGQGEADPEDETDDPGLPDRGLRRTRRQSRWWPPTRTTR